MTKPPADPKAERLAAALRANLAKRKAQARGTPAADAGDTKPETTPSAE